MLAGIIAATLWLRTQVHTQTVEDANKRASFCFFTLIMCVPCSALPACACRPAGC